MECDRESCKTIARLSLTNAFYAGLIVGILISSAILCAWVLAKWSMGL